MSIELPTAKSVLRNPSQDELRALVAEMPNAQLTEFGNYNVTARNDGTWTVTPKAITVTADGGSSTYGDSPASPGWSADGLVNDEDETVLTGLANDFAIDRWPVTTLDEAASLATAHLSDQYRQPIRQT